MECCGRTHGRELAQQRALADQRTPRFPTVASSAYAAAATPQSQARGYGTTQVASDDAQTAPPVTAPAAVAPAVATPAVVAPAPVADVLDLSVAAVVGVFIGAVAHSLLSMDLSVAAGALASGVTLQCQRSTGALEMREFISFVAGVALRQGRNYGAFVIFLIFLIKGIAGTPTSSSGVSSHFDTVLDAGKLRRRQTPPPLRPEAQR